MLLSTIFLKDDLPGASQVLIEKASRRTTDILLLNALTDRGHMIRTVRTGRASGAQILFVPPETDVALALDLSSCFAVTRGYHALVFCTAAYPGLENIHWSPDYSYTFRGYIALRKAVILRRFPHLREIADLAEVDSYLQ